MHLVVSSSHLISSHPRAFTYPTSLIVYTRGTEAYKLPLTNGDRPYLGVSCTQENPSPPNSNLPMSILAFHLMLTLASFTPNHPTSLSATHLPLPSTISLLYTTSDEEAQRINRGGHTLAPVGGSALPIIVAPASVAESSGGRL